MKKKTLLGIPIKEDNKEGEGICLTPYMERNKPKKPIPKNNQS
jgi:hypothetical protein